MQYTSTLSRFCQKEKHFCLQIDLAKPLLAFNYKCPMRQDRSMHLLTSDSKTNKQAMQLSVPSGQSLCRSILHANRRIFYCVLYASCLSSSLWNCFGARRRKGRTCHATYMYDLRILVFGSINFRQAENEN